MRDGVDVMDTGSLPMTEPHHAPIFDTGPHPEPLHYGEFEAADYTPPTEWTSSAMPVRIAAADTTAAAHSPEAAPGQLQFVTRWKFALLTAGVWLVAAALGAGLYYWWFHAFDKTWPDAGALLLVIVCVVAALLVSMAEARPMVSALSLALMSAPCAAAWGAALLYGSYAFGWVAPG